MLAKDKTQFNALCADELTYGHSSGKVESKAEFILGAISPKWHWNTLEFVRDHEGQRRFWDCPFSTEWCV